MKQRPTYHAIALHWMRRGYSDFVIDHGEPSCFACHYWKPRDSVPEEIESRWANSGLERAHIVAKSSGRIGLYDPANYLILCKRCHTLAPMTTIPGVMIEWALKQEFFWSRLMRECTELIADFGITGTDLRIIEPRGLIDFMRAIEYTKHPHQCESFLSLTDVAPIVKLYIAGVRSMRAQALTSLTAPADE